MISAYISSIGGAGSSAVMDRANNGMDRLRAYIGENLLALGMAAALAVVR